MLQLSQFVNSFMVKYLLQKEQFWVWDFYAINLDK